MINPLFTQLRELTRNWNSYEDIPISQQHECKSIGKKLDKEGGYQLMTEAYYYVKNNNRSLSVIQAYWDGIGEWQW